MSINQYEHTVIKNENLPPSWREQEQLDNLELFLQQSWDQRFAFYDYDNTTKKQQFLIFGSHGSVRTDEYVGTISFNGEQLNIFPKVFRTDIEDYDTSNLSLSHLMSNLTYWITFCNKWRYPFLHITSDLDDCQDLREFFITLYTGYVKDALHRSLYYQYINIDEDDCTTIKGHFDIRDYISKKIPYGRNHLFHCQYDSFEFDNPVNRIIKYTCKRLYNISSAKNQRNLSNIIHLLDSVSDVYCVPKDCDNITLSKMHKHYSVVLGMSKMFLLNKLSSMEMGTTESFCFLFPMSALFESFIGSYIASMLEQDYKAKVYLQKSDQYLFNDIKYNGESLGPAFKMRQDIVIEVDSKLFVLDTKYKMIPRFTGQDTVSLIKSISDHISQDDAYQLSAYARSRGCHDVYLLYPLFRFEENEEDYPYGIIHSADNNEIFIHLIRLPFIIEFNDRVTTEKNLYTAITKALSL